MSVRSARDIADAIRAGRLDPSAPTKAALARCETIGVALNALTQIEPDKALEEAARLPARLASGARLPLAGVPLIVKDNLWVEGWRITQGSRLFADFIAPRDALAVARAREKGAVVIAISACSEFAAKGVTATPLHGIVQHPLDPALTPGGSSGGSAAALAACVAPLSLGTDAGGSSRRPPAHCGIVGLKPSQGAVAHPFGFAEPFWGLSCIAPMARDVADAALLFEAIVGPDALDPESRDIAPRETLAGDLRIAFAPRLGLETPIDAAIADNFAASIQALRGLSRHWQEAAPDWPPAQARGQLALLQFAGLAGLHGPAYRAAPERIDPDLGAQIERGFSLAGSEIALALEASLAVRRAVARFFTRFDLMLCPTTPCCAWPHGELGPPMIGGEAVDPRGHAVFTPLFNHAHNPAISIPCGKNRASLPMGLQIIGPVGQDRRVLAFAAAAEQALSKAGLWSPPGENP